MFFELYLAKMIGRRMNIANNQKSPRLPLKKLEELIIKTLDKHKADNIVSIDLGGKSDVADRMVVASGTSSRHVSALADYVVLALKQSGYGFVPTEGAEAGDWVLVDAGDVIVHIFKPEIRELYNLEKMWSVKNPEVEIAL